MKTHIAEKTAILVDGGFFIKRYRAVYPGGKSHTPRQVLANLYRMIKRHVGEDQLYRTFFYDCTPADCKAHNPVNGKFVDFGKTPEAVFRKEFHENLKRSRKVALRLGHLQTTKQWLIRPRFTKELLKGSLAVSAITERDVYYDFRQKGVDMRLGLDVASLAYKKLVQTIVIIAGDADFVSAAKLARREGIDVVLDPMWNHIHDSLFEHIDGLKSTSPKPSHLRAKGN